MHDYLKCDRCPEEDHEGKFCRCESRNIRIAKEQRARMSDCKCKMAVVRGDKIVKYPFHEVRLLKDTWLKQFEEENGSTGLEEYKDELEKILSQCTCRKDL